MKLLFSFGQRGNTSLRFFHKTKLLVLAWTFLALQASAQVDKYTFEKLDGTYQELTDATIVAQASETDNLQNKVWTVALPFQFMFNGNYYENIKISSNAFITVGDTPPPNTLNTPISSTEGYKGAISIFGSSLVGHKIPDFLGVLSTKLISEEGEEVFVIEYKNWGKFTNSTENFTLMNFQIHLRANGVIKMVYGEFTKIGSPATANGSANIGLRGDRNGDNLTLINNPTFTNPDKRSTASATQNYDLSNANPGKPTIGFTYIWTPAACQLPNLATVNNVLSTTATVTGNAVGTTTFDYEFRTNARPGINGSDLITGGTFTGSEIIDGLPQGMRLFTFIRANCGTSFSGWINTGTVTTTCSSTELPYNEGFNRTTIPNCWSTALVNGTSSKLTFVQDAKPGLEGTHAVKYTSTNGHIERLIAPTFNTTGVQNVMVEFSLYHETLIPNYKDSVYLTYSIDNGTTWIKSNGYVRTDVSSGWKKKTAVLPTNAGNIENLKIGFLFVAAGGNPVYIDDFKISEAKLPEITSTTGTQACVIDQQLVTINGQYFDNAILKINDVEVAPLSLTNTKITFVATPGQSGSIVITTPYGSATVTQGLNIVQNEIITLSKKTVYDCINNEVLVNVTSPAENFTNYTWSNTAVTGSIVNGFILPTMANENFTLTATKEINGVTCTAKDSVSFRIIPGPIVTKNTVATLCENTDAELKINYNRVETTIGNLSYLIGPNPFDVHFGGYKQQSIYRAQELTAMGWTPTNGITSLTLTTAEVNNTTLQNFRIRIAQTEAVETTTNFISTGFTTYFTADLQVLAGDNTFTLSEPFFWDGLSNIVIEFAYSNNNRGSGIPYTTAYYEVTELNSTAYALINNQSAANVYDATTANENAKKRNVIKFGAQETLPQVNLYTALWSGNNLFTDAARTTPYTNESVKNVFFQGEATSEVISVTVTNVFGCTTTETFNINVQIPRDSVLNITTCDNFTYRGQTYTESGRHIFDLETAHGCDSTVTLNLNINRSTVTNIAYNACNSYEFNGQVYTEPGVYTAHLQTQNGCDSTVVLTLTFSNTFEPIVKYEDSKLSVVGATTSSLFQWINCQTNQTIPGANQVNYTPTTIGSYKVKVFDGSCSGTSACFDVTTLAVAGVDDAYQFAAVPNPTSNVVKVTYNSNEAANVSLKDMSGKTLMVKNIQSGDTLDLSAFAPGIYVLNIATSGSEKSLRIVRQ